MMFAQIVEEVRLVVETLRDDQNAKEAFLASHGTTKKTAKPVDISKWQAHRRAVDKWKRTGAKGGIPKYGQ